MSAMLSRAHPYPEVPTADSCGNMWWLRWRALLQRRMPRKGLGTLPPSAMSSCRGVESSATLLLNWSIDQRDCSCSHCSLSGDEDVQPAVARSADSSVGKECVSTRRYR